MEIKANHLYDRQDYVDIAKAIGIICVILGHEASNLGNMGGLKCFVSAFHMPLFFAVSGITWHWWGGTSLNNFGGAVEKRFYRLMVPYFLWALIYCDFSYSSVAKIIYGSRQMLLSSGSVTALWFLPVMFLSVVILQIIYRLLSKLELKQEIKLTIIFIFVVFITYVMPRFTKYGYPWGFDISFCGMAFILIGIAIKRIIDKVTKWWIYVIGAVLFTPLIFTYRFNSYTNSLGTNEINMCMNEYGNVTLFFITAICGIIAVISISKILEKVLKGKTKNFIVWIGANSMGIYLIHKPLMQFINKYLLILSTNTAVVLILSTVLTLVLSGVATLIIKRYVPIAIGD